MRGLFNRFAIQRETAIIVITCLLSVYSKYFTTQVALWFQHRIVERIDAIDLVKLVVKLMGDRRYISERYVESEYSNKLFHITTSEVNLGAWCVIMQDYGEKDSENNEYDVELDGARMTDLFNGYSQWITAIDKQQGNLPF